MEGLQAIKTYREFKAATDREVRNQAEGFVRLGYLLRRAEDTDILSESGYKTVTEFARAEYRLTETYVSRYISINKRYSEGGYSDRLMDRFQGFGLAKLADMLTLPDGVMEAIPAEATRAEIQEIKREVAREQQVSDLEVLMEPKGEEGDIPGDILTAMLKEYYHDAEKLEEYQQTHAALQEPDGEKRKRKLFDVLAPAGDAIKMARVPGVGRLMLTVRDTEQPPELLNVRSGDKKTYTWEEFCGRLKELFDLEQDPAGSWEAVYQERYPDAPAKDKRKAGVVGIAKAVPAQPMPPTQPKEEPEEKKELPEKRTGKIPGERTERREISGEPKKRPGEQETDKIAPVQDNREESVPEPEGGEESPIREGSKKLSRREPVSDEEKEEPETRQAEKKAERDSSRQQVIESLKREALEQTEEIRRALEKGYYNMAHMGAKKLMTVLDAVKRELDRKGVPGQMEITEFIGQEGPEHVQAPNAGTAQEGDK